MPRKAVPPIDGVAEVVSIEKASPTDVEALVAKIKDLESKLEVEKVARSKSEQKALDAVQNAAPSVYTEASSEKPTGKKIKVMRCTGYKTVSYKDDGRPILKPEFEEVEKPTYFYRVDLPPVGGIGLTINQQPLYHGVVYEFDEDSLRSVKDMVFKVWDHEKNIHGTDENAFRRPRSNTIHGMGV